MSATLGSWRVCNPEQIHAHEFPEGVAVYDACNKLTLFVPDPAGAVLAVLLRHPLGLDEAAILQALTTEIAAELTIAQLDTALGELEQQQIIAASA